MIPRIIHYCWFGKGPLPELASDCIASWRRLCPDYEIRLWCEDSFDISSNPYVKEAYEAKKYAFVTDYVRLYALYTVGGVYMDTDVELIKPLDGLLSNEVFSGFESKDKIPTAVMGAVAGHKTVKYLLDYYEDRHFMLADGSLDTTTNVEIITDMMSSRGLCADGEHQTVEGFTLYPMNVLCPDLKRLDDGEYMRDTVAVHHFMGSWKSERRKAREARLSYKFAVGVYRVMRKVFGGGADALKRFISKHFFKD
ncbi:MAG: glycosyl transferase [Clostridia bacterium]|nr:glycosyl transferase [Clostridia bacterium]